MAVDMRRCTREYYEEALKVMNTAFGYEDPDWFCKNYGHVCPYPAQATDEDIQKFYMTAVDGKIVAIVGCFPVSWVVADEGSGLTETLTLGGIGEVCCLAEHRGNGFMSAMLRMALDDMGRGGLNGSWLQGDRIRYGHFGWDFAGNNLCFDFAEKQMKRIFAAESECSADASGRYSVKAADEKDLEAMGALYATLKSRTLRTEGIWKQRIRAENTDWRVITNGDKKAYACLLLPRKNIIAEAAGDFMCVMHGIQALRQERGLNNVSVYYPACEDALAVAMYQNCAQYTLNTGFNLNILNVKDTFKKLEKFIFAQAQGTTKLSEGQVMDALAALTMGQMESLCRKLLGYAYCPLPSELAMFAFLKPLLFWLPCVDDV